MIRRALPGPRQRHPSGAALSSRSAKAKSMTANIVKTCPCPTNSGSSINAQHTPAHEAPCVQPEVKRGAIGRRAERGEL